MANNMTTAAQKLRDAAAQIETALVLLNTSSYKCKCCGADRFESFEEAKTYQQFSDTSQKLKASADRLDKKASFAK